MSFTLRSTDFTPDVCQNILILVPETCIWSMGIPELAHGLHCVQTHGESTETSQKL